MLKALGRRPIRAVCTPARGEAPHVYTGVRAPIRAPRRGALIYIEGGSAPLRTPRLVLRTNWYRALLRGSAPNSAHRGGSPRAPPVHSTGGRLSARPPNTPPSLRHLRCLVGNLRFPTPLPLHPGRCEAPAVLGGHNEAKPSVRGACPPNTRRVPTKWGLGLAVQKSGLKNWGFGGLPPILAGGLGAAGPQ